MTTSYVFTHKRDCDEYRVFHVGKHLLTATKNSGHIIQEFENDAAAKAHVDRFIALRKRAGYAVRETEQANDSIGLPRELSDDPLTKFVHWVNKPPRRLAVRLPRKKSLQTLKPMVDRIEKEKPPMLSIDFSSKAPLHTEFAREFIGRSLPTIRSVIMSQIFDCPLNQHDLHNGNLAHVFAAMPELQRAFLNGDLAFCPFQHSALLELFLQGDPMRIATVEALGACSLPALRKLGITVCEEMDCECRIETLAIALSTLDAPCLEWLHVRCIEDIAFFLDAFLSRGLPSSLHTLRLEGEIPDEDTLLDVLTRYGDALSALRHISLPLLDEISLGAVERVKEILPCYVDQGNVSSLFREKVYDAW